MRPPIRTNFWLCILCSVALAVSIFSSPIRAPMVPGARIYRNFLARNFALVDKYPRPAVTTASPGQTSIDADDFEDEDDDESFWSFSPLVCPTFVPSHSPPSLLSSPRPGSSPPRTAAVPLRC